VRRRHFSSTAAKCFLRGNAEDIIERLIARSPIAIDVVAARLPQGSPERVAATIFEGIYSRLNS
jgi:serine/threonine-protein kinase HipA